MALRYLPGNPFKHISSARPPFTFHWRQPFFYLMAPRPGQEREVHPHVPIPPSYVFVKKGDPYITRHCRQLTKETGKDVYVVVDHHNRPLGLRVPHAIHTTVLAADAATKAARLAATGARDARLLAAARETLLRLFPRTPPDAADAIVAHAFRKRSGRVGRAADVALDEKVALGLRAHVRHRCTPYDGLMRDEGVGREEARRRVAGEVEEVVGRWRGDGGGGVEGSGRRASLRGRRGAGGGEVAAAASDAPKKRGGKTAAAAKVGGGVVTTRKPRTRQKRTVSKSTRVTKGPRKSLKSARTRRTKNVARVR